MYPSIWTVCNILNLNAIIIFILILNLDDNFHMQCQIFHFAYVINYFLNVSVNIITILSMARDISTPLDKRYFLQRPKRSLYRCSGVIMGQFTFIIKSTAFFDEIEYTCQRNRRLEVMSYCLFFLLSEDKKKRENVSQLWQEEYATLHRSF